MKFLSPFCFLFCLLVAGAHAADQPVVLTQKPDRIVLANGLISAEIAPKTGDLLALQLGDRSLLAEPAYLDWQDGKQRRLSSATLEIRADPAKAPDGRAELAFLQPWSRSAAADALDVELHYVLRPGERALRMFVVFRHPADYPAGGFGQSRFVVRLRDDLFDLISVDAERTRPLPPSDTRVETLGPKESMRFTNGPAKGDITDKYHYFTEAGGHFFHGWMGSRSRLGAWIVYGSTEDANGGPTRQHNTAHWPRMLLKILSCSHYGSQGVSVNAGESWEKVYGPWMLYLNTDGDPAALRADAARRAETEQTAFPPSWLEHPAFPLAAARGSVTGHLALADPQAVEQTASGAWVGLAAPSPDWQQQALGYQAWTRADTEGRFTLRGVRPGRYTLYAFVDGVLDEFRRDGVEVGAGGEVALGDLAWTPRRHGRQLWQIGVPDRSAKEFRHGDDYRRWGLWLEYPKEFPRDVNFVVGESEARYDWNFAQGTRPGPDGKTYIGTTWRVVFLASNPPAAGNAVLRLAFAASHNASLRVLLNGKALGENTRLPSDNALARAGIHGQYSTWDIAFPATLLVKGKNTLAFEQRAGGSPFKNVMYDCLRLELPEAGQGR